MTKITGAPDLLRSIRAKLDLTQEQLAERLGVSFATVNRWEGGANAPQKAALAKIQRLADEAGTGDDDGPEPVRVVRGRRTKSHASPTTKPMEQMLWDAACSIRGEKDAAKFKDYLLPLLFLKRLSDVFDDEVERLAEDYGNRETALEIAEGDHSLLRFYIPAEARWGVISGRVPHDWPKGQQPKDIGDHLTRAVRAVVKHNPRLSGVIDVVDFAAERNGERDINPAKLRAVVETFSDPRYRLGLADVQPDFLGRAYEYLLRKFAEGSGQSAGEFFTPTEVGFLMAHIMKPRPGEECHDYACGSAGLLVKLQIVARELDPTSKVPLRLTGQELQAESYAVAEMNGIIHDMTLEIARGDTMINPKFRTPEGRLRTADIVVANPMWNQPFDPDVFERDNFDRFSTAGGATTGKGDWAWLQHTLACMNERGRAAVVLDTGAVTRGSGSKNEDKERNIRRWFVERDLIDGVILLPENLFYNTSAAGVIVVLSKRKSAARKGKIVLVNASKRVEKGRPKNFIPEHQVREIAGLFLKGEAVEGEVAVITNQQAADADFNLSVNRWLGAKAEDSSSNLEASLAALTSSAEDSVRLLTALTTALGPVTSLRASHRGDELPETWSKARLGDVCLIRSGGTPPKSDAAHWSGPIPWVSGKDLKLHRLKDCTDHVSEAAARDFSEVAPSGSVLVLVRGMGLAKGFAASRLEQPMAFNQDLKALIPSDRVSGAFLVHHLKANEQRVLSNVSEAAHGTKRLSQDDLAGVDVTLPPLEEQESIAHLLDTVIDAVDLHKRIRASLEGVFKALLHKLMTGEIRVADLDLSALESGGK